MRDLSRSEMSTASIVALAYELLDAHEDTTRLASDLASDVDWAVHLDYLRALHRIGRSMLARVPACDLASRVTSGTEAPR